MKILLLSQYLLVVALLQYTGDVTGQFIAAPPTCSGNTFTFRCTVGGDMNGITIWRVGGSSDCLLRHTSAGNTARCGSQNAFTATPGTGFGTSGTSFSSTLSGTATPALNGTLVECFGPGLDRDAENMVGVSTLQTLGPPSVPMLSCVGLSENINGTVNITVNWTRSGGDSADFYLINITTNAPQTPYGGLLNIITASVTQCELTGFMSGYKYNITVRGGTVNCGGLEGSESKTLTITPQVPATPMSDVCAVYDKENETLQIIESSWDEVDDVTVSEDCTNGNDISASYELSYTTDSGTLNATCIVNATNCSNDTCRYELPNNTADSRCQPPVSKFSNEDVTVSVTAGNIVGRSKSSVPRSITGRNVDLEVRIDTTNLSSAFVECTFEGGYNCTIDYGTDPSYTNLVYSDMASTTDQRAIITLSQKIRGDTTYHYIVSAESSSRCVRVLGKFRAGCKEADLTGGSGTLNPERCADRGFVNSSSISGGVVCYNGTTAGSRAVYICNDGFVLMEANETRVCQSDGMWNGSIPRCIPEESDQIGPIFGGVIGGAIGVIILSVLPIVIITAVLHRRRSLRIEAKQCDLDRRQLEATTNSNDTHSDLPPLHKAARKGDLYKVEELVKKKADVNVTHILSGVTPLHKAAEGGHMSIVEYLVENGAKINVKENTGYTPLHMAALRGDMNVVVYLVERGADIVTEDTIHRTPLHYAAKGGRKDILKYFFDVQKVHFNVEDCFGKVPLHLAAGEGHLDIVRYLVEDKGADNNVKDKHGLTPLHRAARRGRKNVVEYLVGKGACIDDGDNDQKTPLHWAAEGGHKDTVVYLVSQGARIYIKDCNGSTPLELADKRGHKPIVEYLELSISGEADEPEVNAAKKQSEHKEGGAEKPEVDEAKKQSEHKKLSQLHMAAAGGDLNEVTKLLNKEGAKVNIKHPPSGLTPLHMAAQGGHINIVEYLVNKGAVVKTTDNTGCTPLHMAALHGDMNVVVYLVKRGADINTEDIIRRRTPLHFAAKGGHKNILEHFLDVEEADVNNKDVFGKVPLHIAAGEGHLDTVRYLVEMKKADINIKDIFGLTPLHRAARRGHKDIVEYLFGKGAGIDNGDGSKRTSLHWAAEGGHKDTVEYLVGQGASKDIKDCDGMTPLDMAVKRGHKNIENFLRGGDTSDENSLHMAAKQGNLGRMKYLVDQGADISKKDDDGRDNTSLHMAAEGGHTDILRYLLDEGAAIDVKNVLGRTPLHVAAGAGHVDTVEYLFKEGANINFKDDDGSTPQDVAAQMGRVTIVEYLKRADVKKRETNV